MVRPTIAKLISATSGGMHFETTTGLNFYVVKFSDKILELKPSCLSTIQEMVEIVAGCFETRSTFANVKQVDFTFSNKKISIKKEDNTTPEMIYKKWDDAPYEKPWDAMFIF